MLLGVLGLAAPLAPACDSDAECGVGRTCRERDVCLGADHAQAATVEVPTQAVSGQRREHAKAWLGDPEQRLDAHLPGHEVGGPCTVTQDCPAGFDCVVAGFEGRCVAQ